MHDVFIEPTQLELKLDLGSIRDRSAHVVFGRDRHSGRDLPYDDFVTERLFQWTRAIFVESSRSDGLLRLL